MKVEHVKIINNSKIKAFFSVVFEDWGLTIRDCKLVDGPNGLFVGMPSKEYTKDNQKKYLDLVVWNKDKREIFEREVLDELRMNSELRHLFI